MPNGRCYLHGGATPVGVANANYKHGRYSKYLPENLRTRYEQGLADPELLELRSEIALLDARLAELLTIVKAGNAIVNWNRVHRIWKEYRRALVSSSRFEQMQLLAELDHLIDNSSRSSEAWLQVQKLLEQRRKLVDTESRRMLSTQQMVTVEQAMALLYATIQVLKDAVYAHADPLTARHIIADASAGHQRLINVASK